MSIILGYQTENKIVIAGDNRVTFKDGNLKHDNLIKVFALNNTLAYAISGNVAYGLLIQETLNSHFDILNLSIEDFLSGINIMYRDLPKTHAEVYPSILNEPVSFLIGGKTCNGEYAIMAVLGNNGKPKFIETERGLLPPNDLSAKECEKIFIENIERYPNDYYIKTIKKIAEKSQLVSISGDAWIFNIQSKQGRVYHFK